jgi:multidrug efflux pump subunit AcrA (membrane-fusion protein)
MRTTQNIRQISRPAKAVVIGCAMLTAIFISGLQYFVLNLPDYKAAQTKLSDGIVVITGGQQRLDAGTITTGEWGRVEIINFRGGRRVKQGDSGK